MMKQVFLLSFFLLGLHASGQAGLNSISISIEEISTNEPFASPVFARLQTIVTESPFVSSIAATSFNFTPQLAVGSQGRSILPDDFQAIRPLNILDHVYFGGSNDLLGLRPIAIAQQRMPDPMLRNLHTLYIRSSIGLKKQTRLVMHCECLLFVKTMSNMAFLLPHLGLRQRF